MRSNSWRKGPAQLTQRINILSPLLLKAGIQVEIKRSKSQRGVVLTSQATAADKCTSSDDAAQPASSSMSVDKVHHPKGLQHPDVMTVMCLKE